MIKLSITFDDSLLSTYKNAFPLMKDTGIPGNIAVVTGFVGSESGRYYTWDHIQEMADAGWEIVSHSQTHDMWDLDEEKVKCEVIEAKNILNNKGYPAEIFIPPGGPWLQKQRHNFIQGTAFSKAVMKTYAGCLIGANFKVTPPDNFHIFERFGCECYDDETLNKTPQQIRDHIDTCLEDDTWCHLGWHDVSGKNIETFGLTIDYLKPYLKSGKMEGATISRMLGIL
jgi:hypothetical protein